LRICDEANPCNHADFSVIITRESTLAFLYMEYKYMIFLKINNFPS
jgi:hypothetical protein